MEAGIKEYIIRADLMQKLTADDAQKNFREMDGAEAYAKFVELVNEAPAADVVEGVRGEWIEDGYEGVIVCSYCGVTPLSHPESMNTYVLSRFCPNCGADMRKDEA